MVPFLMIFLGDFLMTIYILYFLVLFYAIKVLKNIEIHQ